MSFVKACVITLHTLDNYGSAMQIYATHHILKCGNNVDFVDYWRQNNLSQNHTKKALELSAQQN